MCLEADTALDPALVLRAVSWATAVRGNWFVVWGDHVAASPGDASTVVLRIGGSCAFRAVVLPGSRTVLRVGGMDRWVQSRSYFAGFVPAGFAHVQGFFAYKLFLTTVAAELHHLDPSARLRIGAPS